MSIQTTMTVSRWQRIKSSLAGVVGGIILIIFSIALLWRNEGNYVMIQESLDELGQDIITIDSDAFDSSVVDKPLHVQGELVGSGVLVDAVFGVTVPEGSVFLRRSVEMYQWVEHSETEVKENLGGSQDEVTTYTYQKEWRSDRIDSSSFVQQQTPSNPSSIMYDSDEYRVGRASLGSFFLGGDDVHRVPGLTDVSLASLELDTLPLSGRIDNNYVVVPVDGREEYGQAQIGDIRVSWQYIPSSRISVIAQSSRDGYLQPYQTRRGGSFFLIYGGSQSPDQMIASEHDNNRFMTRVMRIVGVFVCSIGFGLILNVLVVLASVIPFVGSLVGFGTGLVSGLVGMSVGLITISLARLRFRPLISLALLLCVILFVGLIVFIKRRNTTIA